MFVSNVCMYIRMHILREIQTDSEGERERGRGIEGKDRWREREGERVGGRQGERGREGERVRGSNINQNYASDVLKSLEA